jgi:dTDP-4-dehydrorhamnose 3,5-epimerase
LEFHSTSIEDVWVIEPDVFGDERGFFMETFRNEWFEERGIEVKFVQDNLSFSRKDTLRGLHYQIEKPQAKLVMVPQGEILDVALDLRQDSETFGQTTSAILNAENKRQMFIPVGFAHGFAVLSDQAHVQYKCSDYYYPDGERGVFWNDPSLEINWQVDDPIISEKDQRQPLLKNVPAEDRF